MSTRFRINALEVETDRPEEHSRREFASGLNLIIGPPGSGKSTIIELIKFGLGLKFRKTPVVDQKVHRVHVEIEAGTQELRLTRSSLTPGEVLVHDLTLQEDIGGYPVSSDDAEVPTIGKRLLEWLGIRDDVDFTVNGQRDTLTFAHVWDYVHVPQSDIDQRIAHHDASALKQRRIRLFQLLFDMIDQQLQELEEQLLKARELLRQAQRRDEGVTVLRERASLPSGAELRQNLADTQRHRTRLTESLRGLRSAMGTRDDRVLTLQGLLESNRNSILRTQEVLQSLEETQAKRRSRVTELEGALDRVQRVNSASALLAPIEFSQCPRCTQSIVEREISVPENTCQLCLQEEFSEPTQNEGFRRKQGREGELPLIIPGESGAQELQLASQREEILSLRSQGEREREALNSHLRQLEAGNRELREEIELLTGGNGPHIEELSQVREALARAEAEIEKLEQALDVDLQIASFQVDVNRAEAKVSTAANAQRNRQEYLRRSNENLFENLSTLYNDLLHALHTPNVAEGKISLEDYLPYIDDARFDRVNISGGNQIPFIVGYWLTLHSTALSNPNYHLPSCLILDSPQKSLGPLQSLSFNIYTKIQAIAGARGNPFQLFVVDTNLPTGFEPAHGVISVDYESPGIPRITHAGHENIPLVEDMELEDE
ncbi:AAA family ATPase [Nocardiopsis sp. NPDC101807]|uniref:AAA family ATPase n=1 Tax=Nocardiopsis sp. NPDC101807 TaxID=3364339 RepID=UPI0038205084